MIPGSAYQVFYTPLVYIRIILLYDPVHRGEKEAWPSKKSPLLL